MQAVPSGIANFSGLMTALNHARSKWITKALLPSDLGDVTGEKMQPFGEAGKATGCGSGCGNPRASRSPDPIATRPGGTAGPAAQPVPNIKIQKTGAEEIGKGHGRCPLLILGVESISCATQ
jgi:hypothetical protein